MLKADRYAEKVQRGREALEAMEYAKAKKEFVEGLKHASTVEQEMDIRFLCVCADVLDRKFDKAYEQVKKALASLPPRGCSALVTKYKLVACEILENMGQYDNALKQINEVLRTNFTNKAAHITFCVLCLRKGEPEKSLAMITRYLQSTHDDDPGRVDMMILKTHSYIAAGDFGNALKVAQGALALDPINRLAILTAARVYVLLGDKTLGCPLEYLVGLTHPPMSFIFGMKSTHNSRAQEYYNKALMLLNAIRYDEESGTAPDVFGRVLIIRAAISARSFSFDSALVDMSEAVKFFERRTGSFGQDDRTVLYNPLNVTVSTAADSYDLMFLLAFRARPINALIVASMVSQTKLSELCLLRSREFASFVGVCILIEPAEKVVKMYNKYKEYYNFGVLSKYNLEGEIDSSTEVGSLYKKVSGLIKTVFSSIGLSSHIGTALKLIRITLDPLQIIKLHPLDCAKLAKGLIQADDAYKPNCVWISFLKIIYAYYLAYNMKGPTTVVSTYKSLMESQKVCDISVMSHFSVAVNNLLFNSLLNTSNNKHILANKYCSRALETLNALRDCTSTLHGKEGMCSMLLDQSIVNDSRNCVGSFGVGSKEVSIEKEINEKKKNESMPDFVEFNSSIRNCVDQNGELQQNELVSIELMKIVRNMLPEEVTCVKDDSLAVNALLYNAIVKIYTRKPEYITCITESLNTATELLMEGELGMKYVKTLLLKAHLYVAKNDFTEADNHLSLLQKFVLSKIHYTEEVERQGDGKGIAPLIFKKKRRCYNLAYKDSICLQVVNKLVQFDLQSAVLLVMDILRDDPRPSFREILTRHERVSRGSGGGQSLPPSRMGQLSKIENDPCHIIVAAKTLALKGNFEEAIYMIAYAIIDLLAIKPVNKETKSPKKNMDTSRANDKTEEEQDNSHHETEDFDPVTFVLGNSVMDVISGKDNLVRHLTSIYYCDLGVCLWWNNEPERGKRSFDLSLHADRHNIRSRLGAAELSAGIWNTQGSVASLKALTSLYPKAKQFGCDLTIMTAVSEALKSPSLPLTSLREITNWSKYECYNKIAPPIDLTTERLGMPRGKNQGAVVRYSNINTTLRDMILDLDITLTQMNKENKFHYPDIYSAPMYSFTYKGFGGSETEVDETARPTTEGPRTTPNQMMVNSNKENRPSTTANAETTTHDITGKGKRVNTDPFATWASEKVRQKKSLRTDGMFFRRNMELIKPIFRLVYPSRPAITNTYLSSMTPGEISRMIREVDIPLKGWDDAVTAVHFAFIFNCLGTLALLGGVGSTTAMNYFDASFNLYSKSTMLMSGPRTYAECVMESADSSVMSLHDLNDICSITNSRESTIVFPDSLLLNKAVCHLLLGEYTSALFLLNATSLAKDEERITLMLKRHSRGDNTSDMPTSESLGDMKLCLASSLLLRGIICVKSQDEERADNLFKRLVNVSAELSSLYLEGKVEVVPLYPPTLPADIDTPIPVQLGERVICIPLASPEFLAFPPQILDPVSTIDIIQQFPPDYFKPKIIPPMATLHAWEHPV